MRILSHLPDKKTIKGHSVARKRRFSGRVYITDFQTYESQINAKAVVLYLKTKELSALARVINKDDFIIIYYDKNTYNDIRYNHLKVPDLKDIPEDFFEMAEKRVSKRRRRAKSQNRNDKDAGKWQSKQLDRFQKEKREQFKVVKLKKDISTAELMENTTKEEDNDDDGGEQNEIEEGINATLNHVEQEFFKSCPKCGFEMKPTFMVIGGKNRISIYQCISCKFYIPRRM